MAWSSPTTCNWTTPTGLPDCGGGTVINYTTFNSPWVSEEPWWVDYYGDTYETAANAVYFVAETPIVLTAF
jgi:hypothetical protein